MTKKRFQKLVRAYFTELNTWGIEHGHNSMNMGEVYRCISKIDTSAVGKTRTEWWKSIAGNNFGVGVKAK